MALNASFQSIFIVWDNIAKEKSLKAIQRFRLQKQHAQITSNVAVLETMNVMVIIGI